MCSEPEIELVFADYISGFWVWVCDCGAENRCTVEPLEVFDCAVCGLESLVEARN